jgi:hypothetical protein
MIAIVIISHHIIPYRVILKMAFPCGNSLQTNVNNPAQPAGTTLLDGPFPLASGRLPTLLAMACILIA